MKWFKHDTDANMDAKLQEVMLDYGLEGYGLYWYCIELIAQRVTGNNLTFELEHDCRIIARNTGSTPQKVEQMMKSFISLGLLNSDNGHVFCLKLASRCDDFTAKAVRRNGVKPVSNQQVGVSPSLSVFVPLEEEDRRRSKKIEKEVSNIYQLIVDEWNSIFKDSLPMVSKLTQKRKSAINGCIAEMKGTDHDFSLIETWIKLFNYAKQSDFLMGVKTDWSMSFDFITTKSKLIKIVEGEYDN